MQSCVHILPKAHIGGGCIIPKTQVFKTFWYTSFSQELAEVQKPKDTCVPIYTLIQARKCESDWFILKILYGQNKTLHSPY